MNADGVDGALKSSGRGAEDAVDDLVAGVDGGVKAASEGLEGASDAIQNATKKA